MKVVAVTACPTGIAHTYMAAEALEMAAKAKNIDIKVETRGSGGALNVLTATDIEQADVVIIAADTKVELDRFAGKPLIQVSVIEGIKYADELLERALKGKVPIFKPKKRTGEIGINYKTLNRFYQHIMNGVSHMLPFVIAGGLLYALAYLTDSLYEFISGKAIYPESLGSYTALAQYLKLFGWISLSFMLPIMSAYIAYSIADRPAFLVGFLGGFLASAPVWFIQFMESNFYLIINIKPSGFLGAILAGILAGYIILMLQTIFSKLPEPLENLNPVLFYPVIGSLIIGFLMIGINRVVGPLNIRLVHWLNALNASNYLAICILLGVLLGVMMASDMGGPINKLAYLFGLFTISENNPYSNIMAAVMIGGMVPPLGIALATALFKNRFTKFQRESGKSNFVMGLTFITEGAIPFVKVNPVRILPAIIIGSAIASGLTMAFDVQIPVPHGGIFVVPLMRGRDPLIFLGALTIGSVVTSLLLWGLLPKQQNA